MRDHEPRRLLLESLIRRVLDYLLSWMYICYNARVFHKASQALGGILSSSHEVSQTCRDDQSFVLWQLSLVLLYDLGTSSPLGRYCSEIAIKPERLLEPVVEKLLVGGMSLTLSIRHMWSLGRNHWPREQPSSNLQKYRLLFHRPHPTVP